MLLFVVYFGISCDLEYELKLLPENPFHLGESYYNCHNRSLAFDESWKWFMKTEKVGQNQPLISDFTSFAIIADKQDSKLCFLISLRRIQSKSNVKDDDDDDSTISKTTTTEKSTEKTDIDDDGSYFHLMLKKHGKKVIDNFQAPGKVSNCEVLKRGWEDLFLKVDHANHETYHNRSGFNMENGFDITSKIRLTMTFYNVEDVSSLFSIDNKILIIEFSLKVLSTTNSTTSTTVSTTTVTTSTPSKETTTEKSTETSDVEASFPYTYLIDSANTSTYIHIKDLKPNTPYKFKFEILIYDSKGNTFAMKLSLVGLYLHFVFFQKMFYIMII